jgi:hypothetical protein
MMKRLFFLSLYLSFFFLLPSHGLLSHGETELLGDLTQEGILKTLPEWEETAAAYQPKPEAIQALKAVNQKAHIEVVLGTWCPDSKEHVSAFFKIIGLVDNPLLSTSYVGIPRDKEARKPYIQGKNIDRVPTFIVYTNDQEKGRIIEHPLDSIEEDLLDILNR